MLKKELQYYNSRDNFKSIFYKCKSTDYISRIQYLDIKTYLCDDILVKVDRAGMANSLEVRSPILDHRLIELAASIPASLKIKGSTGKYIFKRALSENLPPEILSRPKKGFGVPLAYWLKYNLRNLAEDTLFAKDSLAGDLFDQNHIRAMWKTLLSGYGKDFRYTTLAHKIWLIFIFSRWFEKYMKQTNI